MSATELRAAMALAGIFALRMLGLFMILPVFALHADIYTGSTPVLVGLAIGVYGLTQALLQVPFGMLSDRIGRRPVIAGGLLLFAAGSVVAALSDSISGVIIGRALQGSGAVAAAIMALTADLTREEHRTKAMAVIGMSIGLSFALSMVAGPLLQGWLGMPGIFWLTAGLAMLGMLVLWIAVPTPPAQSLHRDAEVVASQLGAVFSDMQLLRLDAGIFILHVIMTSVFVVVPLALRDVLGLPGEAHWQVYLPVLFLSVLVMIPFIVLAERRQRVKQFFQGAVALVALTQLLLFLAGGTALGLVMGLFLYFVAFNYLEANLPSLVSKTAPADKKGTALGVYSSSQFLGAFAGGLLGGWCHGQFGIAGVFAMGALGAGLWFVLAYGMHSPSTLTNYVLPVGQMESSAAEQMAERLAAIAGVSEAVVIAEEGMAYLKIDRRKVDLEALQSVTTTT